MSSDAKADRGLKSTEEAHATKAGVASMNGPPHLRLGGLGPSNPVSHRQPRKWSIRKWHGLRDDQQPRVLTQDTVMVLGSKTNGASSKATKNTDIDSLLQLARCFAEGPKRQPIHAAAEHI